MQRRSLALTADEVSVTPGANALRADVVEAVLGFDARVESREVVAGDHKQGKGPFAACELPHVVRHEGSLALSRDQWNSVADRRHRERGQQAAQHPDWR